MGLTVSRKTATNLAVRRKNERILTVSRKKVLTLKKYNHKIRSRDLLLSLMCYVFMCSVSENYNRNQCRGGDWSFKNSGRHKNFSRISRVMCVSQSRFLHEGVSESRFFCKAKGLEVPTCLFFNDVFSSLGIELH